MATFAFAMNVSLDGYVDFDRFAPGPLLFRHWTDQVRNAAGSLYGRRLYEIMRYWDDEHPEWSEDERAFAEAWRAMPKWVVSRTLEEVGPNATLISDDVEAAVRKIKTEVAGEVDVGGRVLAQSLGEMGLIDEYRLYFHPVVLGGGDPFFAGPRPPLHLKAVDQMDEGIVRLTYAPA